MALPFLWLALFLPDLEPLSLLPIHPQACSLWLESKAYRRQLVDFQKLAPHRREQVDTVLNELDELTIWWAHIANATNPTQSLADRLWHAEQARRLWDWRLWGYPPWCPTWRLECR